MTRAVRSYAALAAGALMVALIAALALTGRSPGLPELHFEPHGIVRGPPSAVVRVEIRTNGDLVAFHRAQSGSWIFDRPDGPSVPSDLASHLDNALQFMHVSEPLGPSNRPTTLARALPISDSIRPLTWSRWRRPIDPWSLPTSAR